MHLYILYHYRRILDGLEVSLQCVMSSAITNITSPSHNVTVNGQVTLTLKLTRERLL